MKFSRLIFFLLLAACSSDNDPPLPPAPADNFIRGADLSFLPEIESFPVDFYDTSGNVKDMLTILAEAGCNTVRLRLWHTPVSGHSNLQEVKAFSQRIKAAGLKVFLTIHYSDTWADPGNQAPPAAWPTTDLDMLKDSVFQYTRQVIQAVHPDYVSPGNEINGGMLWETGRLGNDSNFFLLLEQATIATRQTDTATRIIMHYAGIEGSDWFFDQLDQHGIDYDMIGLSYYPYWHGKDLDSLAFAIDYLSQAHAKPLLIAETAYPFTLGWNDWTHNNIGLEEQLVPGFPATEQGQKDFMQALRNTIESAGGSGFCYWGGEWVAFKGPQASDGSSWENQALFDFNNRALPVMEVFRK